MNKNAATLDVVDDDCDITHCRRAETALEEGESRFRALCEASLAGIYIVQDGRIRYANPALARMLACTPGELNGVSPLACIHPEDRSIAEENRRRRRTQRMGMVDSLR
jgi:PAS domain S-box-containing protein